MKTLICKELPPIIAAIDDRDELRVRELLESGLSPEQPIRYPIMNGHYQVSTTPFRSALCKGTLPMVQLMVERGGELFGEKPFPALFYALQNPDTGVFAWLLEVGAAIPNEEDTIRRFFLWLMERERLEDFLPLVDTMGLSLKEYGGSPLRCAARKGKLSLMTYLLDRGVDINFHAPDPIYPYASTSVLEAIREGQTEAARFLVDRGADITIADAYGDRPYTVALKKKNKKLAAWLASLEPKAWHDRVEKDRALAPYNLPETMVEYLQTGPLRLEFPQERQTRWAELYSYIDAVEIKWKQKKYLSILSGLENYSSFLLVWDPRRKRLCSLDKEHEALCPICTWEEFIGDPGKYLNAAVRGDYDES